jgi:uncharacterized protein (TIGR03437 family)
MTDAVFATHPGKPGDTITIYGIGFGETSPIAAQGQASNNGSPGRRCSQVLLPLRPASIR